LFKISGDEIRELRKSFYRMGVKPNELFEVGRLGFDLGSGQISKAIKLTSILQELLHPLAYRD
jgi:hypothetical protein